MKILILILIIIFQFLFLNNAVASCLNVDFFSRFNDVWLEKYIKEALNNNHELKQADYRVEQYRWEVKNQFSAELPKLSVSSNYLGSHFPRSDYNFLMKKNSYILPFQANYEPDLFLKNRDKTKSTQKLYKAQIANQKGIYISLLTDVASAYINILLLDYLIERQCEIVKDKLQNADFNKNKFNFGVISIIDLNDIFSELESQQIVYDNLVKRRRTTLYNFSTLIGQSANNWEEIERGTLSDFEYQETIPQIINSDLIYNRPDIEEAENKLKSAKIDITVAKKEFFPSFNITGALIFDTAGPGNFFSWNSSFAYLLAGLTQDIFKGGAKIANLKIKKARYLELVEQYRQADLVAIQEINNALNLIKEDKNAEKHSEERLSLEEKNFIAASRKLQSGTISKLDYLKNKNSYNQTQQLHAAAKATRLVDYFTLYKALGGQL